MITRSEGELTRMISELQYSKLNTTERNGELEVRYEFILSFIMSCFLDVSTKYSRITKCGITPLGVSPSFGRLEKKILTEKQLE